MINNILKAEWIEDKEDTPAARAVFAKLFVEELGKAIAKGIIYGCMLNLLKIKEE